MTEENVIKRGFVVNLYAETQLEIVAGFDKTPNTWRSVIWSASKRSQKFMSLFASNTLSEVQLFIPLCCNFTPKSKTGLQVSSALLRREEQLWLDSVSRWCHVKWPSSEPAPEASRDWQETKLWLQQLWLEASVWSSESEITCSTEKKKKKTKTTKESGGYYCPKLSKCSLFKTRQVVPLMATGCSYAPTPTPCTKTWHTYRSHQRPKSDMSFFFYLTRWHLAIILQVS